MSEHDPFNPEDYDTKSSGGGGGKFRDLDEAGDYLLGVRALIKHGVTDKNGKVFTRYSFIVISGPHEGESFLDRIFRAQSSGRRLAYFCKAMRVTKKDGLRLDVPKTFEALVGRAFKASVEMDGKYAQIKYPETNVSDGELATMKAWEAGAKARGQRSSGGSGPGYFDDAPLDDFPADDFGDGNTPF